MSNSSNPFGSFSYLSWKLGNQHSVIASQLYLWNGKSRYALDLPLLLRIYCTYPYFLYTRKIMVFFVNCSTRINGPHSCLLSSQVACLTQNTQEIDMYGFFTGYNFYTFAMTALQAWVGLVRHFYSKLRYFGLINLQLFCRWLPCL